MEGGTDNAYAYVNDPVNSSDYNGQWSLGGIVNAVVKAVTSAANATANFSNKYIAPVLAGVAVAVAVVAIAKNPVAAYSAAVSAGAILSRIGSRATPAAVRAAPAVSRGANSVSSRAAMPLANMQKIASSIADGHAGTKHLQEFAEIGIKTQEQFSQHISNAMRSPTAVRELANGRIAYLDSSSSTVVIYNPAAQDLGTALRTIDAEHYFFDLLK